MPRTKISLPKQATVVDDFDVNSKKIVNLATPLTATDAANKAYVDAQISSGTLGIGLAEDGTYTDGLFTDLVPETPIGIFADRMNEVMKSLAPQPAPNFSSISFANAGTSGKLSFGPSNPISGYTNVPGLDIAGSYTISGNRKGIFNASTTFSGTLADNVAASTNNRPYPANAIGDGDKGILHLEVNGVNVQDVDLTTFTSGNSFNAAGSGLVLSVATDVQFSNGDNFAVFKYRTATWKVTPASQRPGYNTVRVRHEYATGLYRDSQTFDWVVDADTTTTAFSGETLDTLVMTGAKMLSGVEYNTGGSAQYDVLVSNAYKNTYSTSATAVSFTGVNATASGIALSNPATQSDSFTVTNRAVSISVSGRLLNGAISLTTSVDRIINASEASSATKSINGILIDNTATSSTATLENFDDEGYRINTGIVLTDTSYGSGGASSSAYTWNSNESLKSGSSTHNTGLLISNGKLTYPKNTTHITGITNGNFSTVTNGPAFNTATQADYSSLTGTKTYLRYFYTAAAKSNLKLAVTATGTSFVPIATGASGNNLTLEILAPATTKNSSNTVVWKDAVVAHDGNDADVGCYAGTYGNSIPTNWGITLGAKNTSTSGGVVVVRITAADTWTGSIDTIGLTWL